MLRDRLEDLRNRIARAATACGRLPGEVELLAVSKGHPAGAVREALELGLTRFGESYISEAVPKIAEFAGTAAEWVYLGPIQTNKTRVIAENFTWVLGLASERAARRLSEQRPVDKAPLQVCVQVNVDRDPAKSGILPERLDAFVDIVAALPNLTVRGLMTIPRKQEPGTVVTDSPAFAALAELFRRQVEAGQRWDTLSMGMSGDFEAAIAHGASQVRLGTALFGPRAAKPATGSVEMAGTGV